jgi:hypothetical protein
MWRGKGKGGGGETMDTAVALFYTLQYEYEI